MACLQAQNMYNPFINEDKMPKIKTKSSVKKRFKITATGKVMHKPAGKKHGMSKRSKKFIRNQRAMTTLCSADARIVKLYMNK
jgi:large subunit ribosomal protein L35